MDDIELSKLFPFGALLIPAREGDPSTRVVVGQEWEEEDWPDYFHVWRDPQRDVLLSRALEPHADGYNTTSGDGSVYFLRPLTEDKEFTF